MAEAKLNNVLSAETRLDGSILCHIDMTTEDGQNWQTDYIANLDSADRRGINGQLIEWLEANPSAIKPYAPGEAQRQEPEWLNPPPPQPQPPADDPDKEPAVEIVAPTHKRPEPDTPQ